MTTQKLYEPFFYKEYTSVEQLDNMFKIFGRPPKPVFMIKRLHNLKKK